MFCETNHIFLRLIEELIQLLIQVRIHPSNFEEKQQQILLKVFLIIIKIAQQTQNTEINFAGLCDCTKY